MLTQPVTTDQTLPVLYTFRRCPYAIRARLALSVSSVEYEHREVDLKNKPVHMLELSPKGTVPVLWLPGEEGRVIDESLGIMRWALERNDPLGWTPSTEDSKALTFKLIGINDGDFKKNLDSYKYPSRFGLSNGLAFRDAGLFILEELNQILSKEAFLACSYFSFLDAALAPFIRQFARTDLEWFRRQSLPYLIKWLDYFESSSIFETVMKKTNKLNQRQ